MSAKVSESADRTISQHEIDLELQARRRDTRGVVHDGLQSQDNDLPAVAPEQHRRVAFKLLAAGFSFFVAGANDGSVGALIPYILRNYHVGTGLIAALCASQSLALRILILTSHLDILHPLLGGW